MNINTLFSVNGATPAINTINSELCRVASDIIGTELLVCHKSLTFGGRDNIPDELRIQIQFSNNNLVYGAAQQGNKAILIGISDSDDIVCAWRLSYSQASAGTISKQIKGTAVQKANDYGFYRVQNKFGDWICVFKKEFIYFYIQNCEWLHGIASLQELNVHAPAVEMKPEIDETKRIVGGMNVLLYGVPGCGKSYIIKTKYCSDADSIERVVFHPDYTYGDFVGQIMPMTDEETGKIKYEFSPGPFTRILSAAYNNPDKKYCLIIEEINRGNAPAIFGDIFQLLDRDESGCGSYDITNIDVADNVYVRNKSDIAEPNKIKLPSNLYIFATMNTSDQNVFTLDTAFQRRWNMRMVENDVAKSTIAGNKILDTSITWAVFNKTVNQLILLKNLGMTSSEDKRLGAYFVTEKDLHFFSVNDGISQEEADDRNHNFPEKVLKYLWDDAFKFTRDEVFKSEYDSLEKVIKAFETAEGDKRFRIFADDILNISKGE